MPQPRYSVPALLVAAAAASFAMGAATAQAQPAGEFVHVTDAMLQDPDPADWPMWRRTLDGVGLQPPRPGEPRQRGRAADGVVARPAAGHPGGHAAGLRRCGLHADGHRHHPGPRRDQRRPHLGVPPRPARRRLRVRRRQRPQHAEHRHLRPADHQHQRRRLRLCPRRRDRRRRLGDADLRLPGDPRRSTAPAPSSPTAGSSRAGAAAPAGGPNRASSSPTTPAPARSCGGGERCRPPASPATRPGAGCPTSSGCTWARGYRPATTPSCG